MKTVKEFIQRLQNDPEFEQMAQAYENRDEFVQFVKSEGYDFTLDQLLDEFKHGHEAPIQPQQESPAPKKTVEEFMQRLQEDPEFERRAQAFENNDAFLEFVNREGYDFTLDQLTAGLLKHREGASNPQEEAPPEPKPAVLPISQIRDIASNKKIPEPSADSAEEEQKRSRALYPHFEGNIGGRRRGMKWQYANSEKT